MFQDPMPPQTQLASFYPDDYYSFEPPDTDIRPRGLKRRGLWLLRHYMKTFGGYGHLPMRRNPLLGVLGRCLLYKPLRFGLPRAVVGGRWLDYGCGSGESLLLARSLGWQVAGIELAPKAAEAGRAAGIDVAQGSIDVLETRHAYYDYILSAHTVEHVVDVQRLFAAFWNALKPGGTLAIEVPNGNSLSSRTFKEFWYYLSLPVHVHQFSSTSLVNAAARAGFVNAKVATYSRWRMQAQSRHWRLRARTQATKPTPSQATLRDWAATLPLYLASRRTKNGDCLVLQAQRPVDATRAWA